MSASDNAGIARQFNDAYNQRDWDWAAAMTADNATLINIATGDMYHGPDGARQFLQVWATAFPDSRVETTNVVAGEQGAAVEFIGRGTQTGPLPSRSGTVPPTGRPVEQHFCSIIRVEDGKITENRLYFDIAGLLQQLGLMPAQRTAA